MASIIAPDSTASRLIHIVNFMDSSDRRDRGTRRAASTRTVGAWMDSREALEALGVRPQTLYAYVSRGLIRAEHDPDRPRRSRYSAHDVRALLDRRAQPRGRADIAARAIDWGAPVLESALSTVRDGRLVYRGHDAARLSTRATLEDCAALLWDAPAPAERASRSVTRGDAGPGPRAARGHPAHDARERGFAFLAAAAATQAPSFGRSTTSLVADARTVVDGFVDALAGRAGRGPVHRRLADAWSLSTDEADLLRQALVLVADHELNASTFAVRVAASAGASLAAAALAGFATLSGPLHGQAGVASRAQLERMIASGRPEAEARAVLARGERLHGFGHPLYPLGDVRAAALLRSVAPAPSMRAALRAGARVAGAPPNVDAALAALTHTLRLAPDAPFVVFAAGRIVGWLAHAMEQGRSGQLIRPRAQYVGP